MHSIKLVWGAPGQVKHMQARAFESNYASPPKGGAIGEFLEQVVFMVHGIPFLATLRILPDSNPMPLGCPIHLFDGKNQVPAIRPPDLRLA
jgi:hypothetical protein